MALAIFIAKANGFSIIQSSANQTVKVGEELSLSCTTDDDYKECTFVREEDVASCTYTYGKKSTLGDWEITAECDDEITPEFFHSDDLNKENRICGIRFASATKLDGSSWTCFMEGCKSGITSSCNSDEGDEDKQDDAIMYTEVCYTVD